MAESRKRKPAVPTSSSPYSDAEFDAAFRRTLRSDLSFIATRAIMLVFVFWIMGRAIVVHDLSAGFLLLPIAVEFLSIFWVGLILSWFVVDCPAFSKMSGSLGLVLFWTFLIVGIISLTLVIEGDSLKIERFGPGWAAGWRKVVETGLIWALIAEVFGLIFASAVEIRKWRQVGGKFVWTSVFDVSMRLAAMLLLFIAGFFAFSLLGGLLAGIAGDNWVAWMVFGFLLFAELGGLIMAVKIHRDLTEKAAA